MARVDLVGIHKSFGATRVLRDVCLDVRDGEFLTLLGPSGCGKSTLLRIVAGLEPQDAGSVAIDGAGVDALMPKERDVAMVFQSYALYPYMTVFENMALPLVMRRMTRAQRLPLIGRLMPGAKQIKRDIEARVREVARALAIDELLQRKPAQLSGGQRQRAALGRAMVRAPKVFLMDEPLSNLDAMLRIHMRAELADLHRRLAATFIYVTHDQSEAMTMSDRVAVMMAGELLQVASPASLYADPANLRVAEFVGSPKINVLPGIVASSATVRVLDTLLPVAAGAPAGTSLRVGIRSECLAPGAADGPSALPGLVRHVENLGADCFLHVQVQGNAEPVIARTAGARAGEFKIGAVVHLAPDAASVLLFDAAGNRIATAPAAQRMRTLG
ncbi:MAG: ABC transporter ATP-binding protein [Alphaproteobacteria bacterium]|nr:ABC transporter ATP-binding protein [Alphaproteobacteria bacterium]